MGGRGKRTLKRERCFHTIRSFKKIRKSPFLKWGTRRQRYEGYHFGKSFKEETEN